jgi:hypothetical protein
MPQNTDNRGGLSPLLLGLGALAGLAAGWIAYSSRCILSAAGCSRPISARMCTKS